MIMGTSRENPEDDSLQLSLQAHGDALERLLASSTAASDDPAELQQLEKSDPSANNVPEPESSAEALFDEITRQWRDL